MLLVKRSRKNQVAIPKAILERVGLGPEDVYFRIGCKNGMIVLQPVDVEDKIPAEALARFEARVLKRERGDKVFSSMEDLIRDLHRSQRRS
jgi:bifunctional DNA-binding transcriptional regulator/antitoxin component of YhaV-PrlF toxin-antitoxin module